MHDTLIERNCLLALDMVTGQAGDASLRWDPAAIARLMIPRALDPEAVEPAIVPALSRSDMLPPRPVAVPLERLRDSLLVQVVSRLNEGVVEPQRADFFRVPKSGFASRPAALLSPLDRIVWEALAEMVLQPLERVVSASVVWPRGRETIQHDVFSRGVVAWETPYIVKTDIEGFYESVDHNLLSVGLGAALRAKSTYTQAVEAFLDAVMSGPLGLPQGPPASEIFATCYLLPVDQQLEADGLRFLRYADDYVFEANDLQDGRRKLEALESRLRALGLRLSAPKTRILKMETYQRHVGASVSPRVVALQDRLRSITEERLLTSEDSDEVEGRLREIGVDDETVWELLYHRSLNLDEVIDGLRERLNPTLVDSYATFVEQEVLSLRRGRYPEDERRSQTDLEESILYLAGAEKWISSSTLIDLLTWHPTIAPAASAYLRNIAGGHPDEARSAVLDWLRAGVASDWVRSWACAVAEAEPQLVDDALAAELRLIARDPTDGPLSRAGATRALAASRRLDQQSWDIALGAASPAMASELYLDAQADPAGYPATPSPMLALGSAPLDEP
ncbi:reverse transcriptase domain-containing protein [Aquipuribacter nitratireducens]|uniref:Reverse transcriptase domain-containing protein n=1 Tax=Aquipuribacter nitratireducens TaxID=650104 RepID=A0ABW0GVB6_9MICO